MCTVLTDPAQPRLCLAHSEEENQEEEPTPSNAEIRQMLHRLQLGLDKKGYGKMDEFKELDADIRVFLRDRQPMRQKVITEFF